MATDPQTISVASVARRLLGKLAEPGALAAARTAMTLSREDRMSIGQVLEQQARQRPGEPAIRYGEREWTWDAVNRWANRCADTLRREGLAKGDVIALDLGNRPETLVLVCAAAKLGVISAMINTSQTGEVLAHSLDLVNPKLIFVGEEQREAYEALGPARRALCRGREFHVPDRRGLRTPPGFRDLAAETQLGCEDDPPETAAIRLADPAFYIFTSGTTGLPKASVMSHYRWYRSAVTMGRLTLGLTPLDVLYCCLPFYHNNALTLAFGSVAVTGASIAIGTKFSARRFWEEVRQYRATTFCYIGEILRYLLNQTPSPDDRRHRVRAILGNGLRPDIWDAFKARFGIERIHEFYASSEGPNGFVNFFNYDRTCGFSPSGWALVAYDIEADQPLRTPRGWMRKLGRGEVGLLLNEVAERTPFDGYTRAEDGEKKLFRDVFKRGDCWYNTGDLMRAQGAGHVQFVDRVGDTYRWQGENVATTQVEAIAGAWPQLQEAVAYGVQVPGREGRCGMLSATLHPGLDLDAAGLAAHLRAALPRYAVPRFLRLRNVQELTATFKHQKTRLKQQGYDLSRVGEPLWFLGPDAPAWQRLDAALQARIDRGEERL